MTIDTKIIEQIILEITSAENIPEDKNLIAWGELDSIDFEQLFNELEKKFNVEIPSQLFTLENCLSPKALALMLQNLDAKKF